MRLALFILGFLSVLLSFAFPSLSKENIPVLDHLDSTLCYTLGVILAWLGITNSGKWKKVRIFLALGLTSLAVGKFVQNLLGFSNQLRGIDVPDCLFTLSGIFLLASAVQSVNMIQLREDKKTLLLDAISINLVLTLVILYLYLPLTEHLNFSHPILLSLNPILVLSTALILLVVSLMNENDHTHQEVIFLLGLLGYGFCSLTWNGQFLGEAKNGEYFLNRILSFTVLMLGYGGGRWKLTENIGTRSFSFSLRFLPIVKVSITSILFILIWNDSHATTALKIIAASITVILYILSSFRQMSLIQEKVEAETNLRSLNQNLDEIIERRTSKLLSSKESVEETKPEHESENKLASIGRLVGNLTHEINTPLGAILASSGTIKLMLEEKLVLALKDYKEFTEEESKVFFEILKKSMEPNKRFDPKTNRTRSKEMMPTFDNLNLDIRKMTEILAEFGYEQSSIPKSLLKLNAGKMETIIDLVKFFSDLTRANEIIHQSTQRSDRLIKSLKSYLHESDNTKKETIRLIDQIENLIFLYYGKIKDHVKFTLVIPSEISIPCYVDELNQVWTNLINNSLDAMERRGEITITATYHKERVEIMFEDNGPGIAKDVQSKIFEAFFTTKKLGEGTGLGLAITKSIIEKHEGSIHFQSSPSGTKFLIILPSSE